MDDIYDYLYWRGDLSFDSASPNEIDMVIFSMLAYIDFLPDMMLENKLKYYNLNKLVKLLEEEGFLLAKDETSPFEIGCFELIKLISKKERYKNTKVFGFSYNFEKDNALQFAAISFILPNKELVISYRGTDASLIGWKEDFLMSFKKTVGSQEYGKEYLEKIAKLKRGKINIVGHSKGGNIALYSALKTEESIQARIKKVYSFDGPGFNKNAIKDLGYLKIKNRMVTLVPQGSVVGILMQHEEPIEIVYSNKKNGIAQHMPFSWQVNVDHFKRIDERANSSLIFDKSIRVWLEQLNEEEISTFIDSIFESTDAAGLEHVYDLKLRPIKSIYNLLNAYLNNDEEDKTLIEKMIGSLFLVMKDVTTNEYKNKRDMLFEQLKKGRAEKEESLLNKIDKIKNKPEKIKKIQLLEEEKI